MLSYETCQKLNEAGFPVRWTSVPVFYDENRDEKHRPPFEGSEEEDLIYIPTLSELIEACKGNTGDLLFWGKGDNWFAQKHKELHEMPTFTMETDWEDIMSAEGIHGKTPEEAVANLYISLNK